MSSNENVPGSPESPFRLRFRGVRGSIPTAAAAQLGIGGNTACVEIVQPDVPHEVLILDAGSGIRCLGRDIMARSEPPKTIHLFFTHFHWDHVQGLPFFLPIYSPKSHIVFHSSHPVEHLREVLAGQMRGPYFPVMFDQLASHMEFHRLAPELEEFAGVGIEPFLLHHPQESFGFRITRGGRTAVYATDHEHGVEERDRELVRIARGADLLVYDSQYTPAEYPTKYNWGHSTWLEATRVAERAGVRRLALFHHDPERTDEQVRAIEAEAREHFPETIAACENLAL